MAVSSTTTTRNPQYIENRNYLSPVGFELVINKLPGVTFFSQIVNLPGISSGTANQPTRFNLVHHPGDELRYEPLQIDFMVDENLKNMQQLHEWLRRLTIPVSHEEFVFKRGLINSPHIAPDSLRNPLDPELQERTDASLIVLSSNYRPVCTYTFYDIFPTSISPIPFDTTVNDVRYLTCRASFEYTYYDFQVNKAAIATDSTVS